GIWTSLALHEVMRGARQALPDRALGELVIAQRLLAQRRGEAGRGRRQVAAADDAHRVGEVLVQVIDVLQHPVVRRGADRDVVEHRQVLDHLAQPDAAGVRADGHPVLRGEQQDRDVLVDARDPAGVDVQHVGRARLEQLLEDHPVRDAIAARILARPRISSGLVGSSTQYGSQGARAAMAASASATPHRWLASTAILMPGPTASLAIAMRRMSAMVSAPTLSLIWVNPSATACRDSAASFSSE